MGRGIVRLAEDEYVEWSTVVDAPVSYAITRAEAVEAFGASRIARADEKGTSYLSPPYTLQDFLDCNRAGEDESHIGLEEMRRRYGQGAGV